MTRRAFWLEGYDLGEIGRKLVNNYVKQVMEDGFFHADPHPGNVKVMDGKIVWIDMGMMGRLSNRDRNSDGESSACHRCGRHRRAGIDHSGAW